MSFHSRDFICGFAIFSMFFGSGNLVFPLQVGQFSETNWFFGFLGLFLTAVILPFLGLFVIKLYKGEYVDFFKEAGSIAGITLPFFILSLLGAFGVIPRCIAVAHAGIIPIIPDISLSAFSIVFCVGCYFFCLKDKIMISILGKVLSPMLLIGLLYVLMKGVLEAPDVTQSLSLAPASFWNGFIVGYQTMDLFAAFFFSAIIFQQQQLFLCNAKKSLTLFQILKPSIIGISLLGAIYLGMVYLGAYYVEISARLSPEQIFPAIVFHIIGEKGSIVLSMIMIISCLTTAVALNNIYARYLSFFTKEKDKNFPWILLGTTFISYLISLLNFKGISAIIAPLLEISYPAVILLVIMCIVFKERYRLAKKHMFYGTLFVKLVYDLFL